MDAEIGKRRLLLFRHKCYVAATVDVDVINDASRAPARGYAAAAYAAHGVTRGPKKAEFRSAARTSVTVSWSSHNCDTCLRCQL